MRHPDIEKKRLMQFWNPLIMYYCVDYWIFAVYSQTKRRIDDNRAHRKGRRDFDDA